MRIPATEILKTIPEFFGIRVNEQPAYRVVETLNDIEIREYEPMRIASVTGESQQGWEQFKDGAFKRLAGYIFGGNSSKEDIAMTSPVFQEMHSGRWRMTFVLPRALRQRSPPLPKDQSVQLSLRPAGLIAAYSYTGNNSKEAMVKARRVLVEGLTSHAQYAPAGEVWWAQYDAPFVLPFVKRNEAMVEVRAVH